MTYLEESLRPPHTKHCIARQYPNLEDTPPLNPRIRALRCIPMCALPNDDISLLILDLVQQLAQLLDLLLKRVCVAFRLGDVDNAVHVEGDFF